jgi:hypothetical protein
MEPTRDNSVQVDGMSVNGIEGDGAIQQYFNQMMFSEMSYQTGAISAETSGGGVRLNMIPKDGGNTFKSDLFFSTTNHSLQARSLTPELVNRGLKAADSMDRMHDFNVAVGGPIKVNRLWFFGSFRHWGVNQAVANAFYNLDPTHQTYKPDPSHQVIDDNRIKSGIVRFTWQATRQWKAAAYLDRIIKFRGHEGAALADGGSIRRTKAFYAVLHSRLLNFSGTHVCHPHLLNARSIQPKGPAPSGTRLQAEPLPGLSEAVLAPAQL